MFQIRCPIFLALVLAVGPAAISRERPNIVFIFSDDHAVQAISSYGGRLAAVAPTPNIDRIAKEGALFKNSFCANSICGPSRASILTGKLSHLNGFMDNNTSRFDESQVTFPALLQKVGYDTALIGKWHLKSMPQGFDHWEILPGQGNYYNPHFIQMDGSRIQRSGYVTDIVTDLAVQWLEETRDADRPFVLMCQQKAPHRNWAPALRHLNHFDDVRIPEPETLFDDYANRSGVLKEQKLSIAHDFYWGHDMKFQGDNSFPEFFMSGTPNREYDRMTQEQKAVWDAVYEPKNRAFVDWMREKKRSPEEVTRWKYQRYMKDYLRCIRALDEGVGRILDTLDQTGLSENTIVIYASDQGFYLGEHGWYDKRWMFEESMKMPFVIRWPGVVRAGSRPAAMIQNIDYAPTFLDIADAPIPEAIQGRSLKPVLEQSPQTPPDWRDALYYAYYGERTHAVAAHDGIRTDRYKLIHFQLTSEWNLFDLEADPQELRSVHADPAYASRFEELLDRYQQLRRDYSVNSAVVPQSRFSEDWWKTRFREKQAIINDTEKSVSDIVFIGDSITQGWEDAGRQIWTDQFQELGAINLGFSGDRTEHVIWRLYNGDLSTIEPRVAVVMIGTNNTGHRLQDANETAMGIKRITEILGHRWPETEILLLNLFPRGEEPGDPMRELNREIGTRIKRLGDQEGITFLDIGQVFLGPDGTISREVMPDFLHLSPLGYRLWAEAMSMRLDELLGMEERMDERVGD